MKVEDKPREYDESTLREAVIEWYEEYGRTPRRKDFGRHPDYPSEAPYQKRWGSLKDACEEILSEYDDEYSYKYAPRGNALSTTYDESDFRDCIIVWYVEMGVAPKRNDFRGIDGFPTAETYYQRLGRRFKTVRDDVLARFDPEYVPPKSSYSKELKE